MEKSNLLEDKVDDRSSVPRAGFVSRHKRKFVGFTVIMVVIMLSLFDVWYGLVHKSDVSVDSAELSLESVSNSDARLTIFGKMSTQSYLSSMSVDDSFCSVQYSDTTGPWQNLGHILGSVKETSSGHFSMTLSLEDVSYSPLRHLLSDTYWKSATGASIQCHIGVTVYLYRLIPVRLYADVEASVQTSGTGVTQLHYASSGISDTNAFKFSTDVEYGDEDDEKKKFDVTPFIRSMKKWGRPMKSWFKHHMKQLYDEQALGLNLDLKNPMDTTEYFPNSFIVSIPQLSVAVTLLGENEEGGVEQGGVGEGRYHFSSTPFQLQLSQPKLQLDTTLSLLCSDSFDPLHPVTEVHACDLFDSKGSLSLLDTLRLGKVSITMDSAAHRNFLTELAGTHHTMTGEVVDMEEVEAKIAALLEQDTTTSSTRALSSVYSNELSTIQDPRISTGGKCVSGSADNVYDTYTCAVVEKGFFKAYLYVFDEDGMLSKIQLLTSWAPSAPFAAATEAVVLARGGYNGQWNSTISELFQNASFSVRYEDNEITKFRSEALAQWDFENYIEEGSLKFISYLETMYQRADLTTGFQYGDNEYSSYLAAVYNDSDVAAGARGYAFGGYGGNAYNWWYSLNESAAYVDHEKQGDASGYLSSAVSLSGDTAVFDLRFLVNDGSENEQIYTNNEISWSTGSIMNTSSSNSWLDSGNINVASVFRLINTIDWNADGLLQYGGDLYNFYARDLSQDSSEVLFSTGGDGKYGGDYYNWYVNLLESYVIIQDDLYGSATGALSSTVSSTGDTALFTVYAQALDSNTTEQVYTYNNITWNSPSDYWIGSGAIAANSVFRLIDSIDWNAHGNLDYGGNKYEAAVSDYNMMEVQQLRAYAKGDYNGTWTDWLVTIDESGLWWGMSKVGSVIGEVISRVQTDGTAGALFLVGSVRDADNDEIIFTNDNLNWFSAWGNWLEKGTIEAYSVFDYPSVAVWNTSGLFNYGEHAYTIQAIDYSGNGMKLFDTYAMGGYGGDWNSWWASLTDSAVILSGSKLGDAVGFISSNIASTGDAAYLTLYTLVNDGSESEQIYTNNTIKWYSDETWTQTGSMYATTAFRLVNSVNWDALGSFTYGDNEYMLHAQDAYANGDEVFLAHAMGGYGGTWTNWFASITESYLYISGSKFGDVVGYVSSMVSSTGDAAKMSFYALVNDGYETQQVLTNNTATWFSPSLTWLESGSIAATSVFQLVNTIDWDAEGSLDYGDNRYTMQANDSSIDGDSLFSIYGAGGYGGSWTNWFLSLTESSICFSGSKFGDAVGYVSSIVSSTGDVAELTLYTLVNDGYETQQVLTNNTATWFSPSLSWLESGSIAATSVFQLVNTIDWDAQGSLDYADNRYTMQATDSAIDGDSLFSIYGAGGYGGSWTSWWASLTESAIYFSDNLFGSATGLIESDVTSNFDTGRVTFTALAYDGSDIPVMELSTNNTITWESPIYDWLSMGNITATSATQIEDILNWDALASVAFNDGNYSIIISDNNLDGTPVFLTQGNGQYRGTWGRWALSITDSVCYINDIKQGSLAAEIDWLNVNMFQTAVAHYTTTVTGGYDQPLFYTSNQLIWYDLSLIGNYELSQGVIVTDTTINGNPEFFLFSQFKLDQTNQTATFNVFETLKGVNGLNASAMAFYDEQFGLLTGIDTTVFYNSQLLFQAHTSWDAQLETLTEIEPTEEPTAVPTVAPTMEPTAEPTEEPTAVPTVAPTMEPTAEPTNGPTLTPTVAPTAVPTLTLTTTPTNVPTTSPTCAPTITSTNEPTIGATAVPTYTLTESPTVVPTTAPTYTPTVSLSAAPTQTGSSAPTYAVTASPTVAPTVETSAVPTYMVTSSPTVGSTSSAPTITVTTIPTADPTVAPTVAESAVPTYTVTTSPTLSPSAVPTYTITTRPTVISTTNPTIQPTRAPTIAPSKQTSPILSFNSNITLAGVTSPTLDYNSQQAMISVTASSMGVSADTVTYKNTYIVVTPSRRYLKQQKQVHLTATYTLVANMKVSVPLSSTTSTTTTDLYTSLTSKLQTAVSDGQFSTDLQTVSTSMGATETAAATATAVSDSPPETSDAPASSGGDNSNLDGGAIAGIVIGVLAGVAIIAAGLWYYFSKANPSTTAAGVTASVDRPPRAGTVISRSSAHSTHSTESPFKPRTGSSNSTSSATNSAPHPDAVFTSENPFYKKQGAQTVGDDNL